MLFTEKQFLIDHLFHKVLIQSNVCLFSYLYLFHEKHNLKHAEKESL